MSGERILEAGSGMGRFTEVLARTGAEVCTFDYSTAVEVNRENNGHFPNAHFAQGDIYHPPYEPGSFDKVLCLGVLQHCPSPREAFLSLTRFLKPGGEICVDNYALDWRTPFLGKYYIRWFTRRMSPEALHRFVRFHVGWVFPFTARLYRLIGRPAGMLSWMLAVASYRRLVTADEATLKELAMLDTFDMLSPEHDKPRTVGMVRGWCRQAALEDCTVFHNGASLVIARGRRPRDT
jgi:SAM-dependent methyltransferase